jgi:transitional endoplasmic reticulum ATPase
MKLLKGFVDRIATELEDQIRKNRDEQLLALIRADRRHCTQGEVMSETTYYDDFTDKDEKLKFVADNVRIERRGKKIILPEGMTFGEAGEWIKRKRKEDEMIISLDEVVEGYPLDAAYAFTRAMSEIYGWTGMVPTPGFWGKKNPPDMFGLQTGPNNEDTVQVPWGRFVVPNISGFLQTFVVTRNQWPQFCIGGEVKNRDKEECAKIARLARKILAEDSIYRGKAIRIRFPKDPDDFNIRDCPAFMQTNKIKESDLIFSDDLMRLVQANLFAPVLHTDRCRQLGIPLKRGVLLEGPYGTGKTLTAHVAAKMCVENGWTFIYLEDTEDLAQAIRFAKMYQPAMIFAEDIDRVMEDQNKRSREDKVQTILNTIDGVDTKNTEIVVVLTTNFIDRITQAMLRPGRLDAVLSVKPPDAKAVQRLIKLFGRELIDEKVELPNVGAQLQGQIPAVIREVVERAKLDALAQDGNCTTLSDDHLTVTAKGMLNHLELLKGKPDDRRSDIEKAADTVVVGMTNIAKMQHGNGHNKDQKSLPQASA